MSTIRNRGGWLLGALALFWLPSCATTDYEGIILDKDRQIEALSEEKFQLELEIDELRGGRASWEQQLADARRKNDELRQELATKAAAVTRPSAPSDLEQDRRGLADSLAGRGLEVVERRGQLAIILPSEITFASGQSELTASGRGNLARIAEEIRLKFPDKRISVEGHTDDDPIRKSKFRSNWHLSVERALTVREALEREGIPQDRFNVAGYGQHQPVASNSNDSGKKRNRRVEIVLF